MSETNEFLKDNIFDPTPDSFDHDSQKSNDKNGIVYTCAAGFIDTGHLRDLADQTQIYYIDLKSHNKKGDKIPAIGEGPGQFGTFEIKMNIPEPNLIAIAQNMAYYQSVFHEIYSYWINFPGFHNSSFSPEDLVSNLFGTYVAKKAILNGGDFNKAIASQLKALFDSIGALPRKGTLAAINSIKNKWMKGTIFEYRYLQRRNFSINPVKPWLIPNVPGCNFRGKIPSDLELSLSRSSLIYFNFSVPLMGRFEPVGRELNKKYFTLDDISTEVKFIKQIASVDYKEKFDNPL